MESQIYPYAKYLMMKGSINWEVTIIYGFLTLNYIPAFNPAMRALTVPTSLTSYDGILSYAPIAGTLELDVATGNIVGRIAAPVAFPPNPNVQMNGWYVTKLITVVRREGSTGTYCIPVTYHEVCPAPLNTDNLIYNQKVVVDFAGAPAFIL